MEGMPRVPMFTPDLKFCSPSLPPTFATQIKEYILIHYQDDPSKYDSAIAEIENMRAKLGRLLPDLETLNLLKRYYAQICLMKNRFPMEEGDTIRIPFAWLDKGMDIPNATAFDDVNYELAYIMYNIGAVHGAIAANESRTDVDSIKNSFTHFQCAAFPFQQIRDSMNAVKYSSLDFDPSLMTFYINILLAQAQECLLEKGILDHRKNTVIAKLAVHLRDVYKQCVEHLEASNLIDTVSSSRYKGWLRTCHVKSEIYGAIAMYHLGCHAEDENKMGSRLAYFDIALGHINTAMKMMEKDKRESLKETVIFLNDVILGRQTNAKKENDFIYHDRVPKPDELTSVEGVVMVKAVGFDPTDRSVCGPDLFATLLPGNVLKSLSVYSEEKAKFKRAIMQKIAEKDKELEDYIKSLQLEEINFDDESKMEELPEMLLERSAAFNSQPDAFPELLDKLHRVGGCAIEADHKISNLRNRLDAITSEHLKSDKGFIAIRKELNRINDHHMKARTNNAELQRALAAHSENLKILAMPLNELSKRLTSNQTKPVDSAEGKLLKKMLDKTNEMSMQRRDLFSKLSEELQNDDITAKCLAEKDEDNQELYEKELKKHEGTANLIGLNLNAQQNILSALTDANANFGDYRRKIIEENKNRMDQVLALTAAYDVYVDVSQKAEEGLKFYSTLFTLVRDLDGAIEAIECAYEEEKKEKEKEMLRGLEDDASGVAGWKVTTNSTQDWQGDLRKENGSLPETGSKGLRLKDCLEYYRTKIAASQMSPLANKPLTAHKNEATIDQTLQSYCTSQLSGIHASIPPLSNHRLAISPNCSAGFIRPPYLSSSTAVPLSSSTSASLSSSAATPLSSSAAAPLSSESITSARPLPQANTLPLASQYSTVQYSQPTSSYQNPSPVPSSLASSNVSQFGVPMQLQNSFIPRNFQHFPAVASLGSTPEQPTQNANLTVRPAISTPFTQPSSYAFSTNAPAVISQSIIAQPMLGSDVKAEREGFAGTAQAHLHTQSPFAPIRMRSDFIRGAIPTNVCTTIAKPAVVPAHNITYSQSSTCPVGVSPWHQSLRNVSDDKRQPAIVNTQMAYANVASSVSSAASPWNTSSTNNPAQDAVTPIVVDLMNAPLDVTLPAPLAPIHFKTVESEGKNLVAQSIHQESSAKSEDMEKMHMVEAQKLSESMQQTPGTPMCSAGALQTARPAAAVAPIMQTDCNTSTTNGSTLCITAFESDTASPSPQSNPAMSCAEKGAVDERRSISVEEIMNPQTFTIGESDPVRLEKRNMRERFKTEGTAAQLPPLDPADPINCIDPHYWFQKS